MARTAHSGLPTAVYLILDPLDPKGPCYVGSSNRPQARFYGHISAARAGQAGTRAEWIRKMLEAERRPELKIIGYYDEEKAAAKEYEVYLKKRQGAGVINDLAPSRGGVSAAVTTTEYTAVVKAVGRSSAHIIVPKHWLGKRVKLELLD